MGLKYEEKYLQVKACLFANKTIADDRLGIVAPAEQYRLRYGAVAKVRKARPDF